MTPPSFKIVHVDAEAGRELSIEERIFQGIGAELVAAGAKNEEDVVAAVKDADAILVVFAPITRRAIEAAAKCKVIARYGVGVDNVDVAAATERGIPVVYVPDYCVEEVSNHALMLLLICARKFLSFHRAVLLGSTSYLALQPILSGVRSLYGETLGLLGFGKIARRLADKARAFDLRVIAHDPFVDPEVFAKAAVEPVDRDTVFKESDYLSCHLPLNQQTYHSIGLREFNLMKPTAFFINTSRGAVVDEDVLLKMLQASRIAGAALDVYEKEPIEPEHPLCQLPNVVLTPHVAYYSDEASRRLRRTVAEETARVLQGGRPTEANWFNREALDGSKK